MFERKNTDLKINKPKAFSKAIIMGFILVLILLPIALFIQHQNNQLYKVTTVKNEQSTTLSAKTASTSETTNSDQGSTNTTNESSNGSTSEASATLPTTPNSTAKTK